MGEFTWKSRRNGGQTAHWPCHDCGFPGECAFAILTTASTMNDNSTAEQNLGAIRGLIERGEIYRAVSARTALIGGVLSILTTGAIYLNDEVTRILDRPVRTNASLGRVVRSALARAPRLGISSHQPECAGVQQYHRQSGRRCSHRPDGRHVRSLSSHLRRSQLAPKTGDAVSNWLEES